MLANAEFSKHPNQMIELRRLNGRKFTLNALMIEQIESLPDTTITLTNGKKVLTADSEADVIKKITSYYQKIGLQRILNEVGEENE